MKTKAHEHCEKLRVKGIKFFICKRCGKDSSNCPSGVEICKECCVKNDVCYICGEKLSANNSKNKILMEDIANALADIGILIKECDGTYMNIDDVLSNLSDIWNKAKDIDVTISKSNLEKLLEYKAMYEGLNK